MMGKITKNKTTKYPFIFLTIFVLLVVVLVFCFYWFEFRPAQIRQECSWVKKRQDATPYVPAKNEEQLRAEGALDDCNLVSQQNQIFDFKSFCEHRNSVIINSNKNEKPAKPAKEWYDKASPAEYNFCIKSKGLTE